MGERYLIDSNVIIDFCNGKLSVGGKAFLMNIEPEISIITNIELFATKNIPKEEYQMLERFVAIATIHPVNNDLVNTTIAIRQNYKLKLPDAIIAATALQYNCTLISRNLSDFKSIADLKMVDPYTL